MKKNKTPRKRIKDKKRKSRLFPKNKIRPDQASFLRRFMALAIDSLLILMISSFLYSIYRETSHIIQKEPLFTSRLIDAIAEGKRVKLYSGSKDNHGEKMREVYLEIL